MNLAGAKGMTESQILAALDAERDQGMADWLTESDADTLIGHGRSGRAAYAQSIAEFARRGLPIPPELTAGTRYWTGHEYATVGLDIVHGDMTP